MPGTPIEIDTLSAQVGAAIVHERALAILAASFGGVALVLAMIGLYGVIAWGVTQRTQEIGVRLALGARRPQVVGLVLADGLRLLALGIALGVPAAWAATRWLRTLLFGVTPADPVSALAAIGLLTAAALLAAYLPARRASRVDPLIALRHE
ncbi:MAG: FtsX-like permease family protein [Vicinamibacteraceae bacterium]